MLCLRLLLSFLLLPFVAAFHVPLEGLLRSALPMLGESRARRMHAHAPNMQLQPRLPRRGMLVGAALLVSGREAQAKGVPPAAGALANMRPDPTQDIIFPASLLGDWQCERRVTSVEGDSEQAALVWLALGGGSKDFFARKSVETFATRFIVSPSIIQSSYVFEGNRLNGVVLDKGACSVRVGLAAV